ncbi:MAG TPA: aspartate carbamoyltransferase catalytic subunit [Ktedonobacterales bacterium]|nr:aspartate carbamoyltransferase catalytic subunit [Ktedonobacterales bacterium]
MTHPRSLLGIETLSNDEIAALLASVKSFDVDHSQPLLMGRRIVLLFYEPSTRTRVSFEMAAKALGATTYLVHATASSIEKGESLLDTGLTLRSMGAEAIVVRHPSSGAPHFLSRYLDVPIINAGDGMHEHPSQALLDAFTILETKQRIAGLKIAVIGDIYHSRVARSDIHLLSRFGADITLCGPPELVPDVAVTLAPGLNLTRNADEAVCGADVVMLLRVQKERLGGLPLFVERYVAEYQMTTQRLARAKPDALVMHPGPMVRGMELTDAVADSARSLVLRQVRNGVPVRMAILARAFGD